MARQFRLWLEQMNGVPAARVAPITNIQTDPASATMPLDVDSSLGGAWALLLAFLDLERRVPPTKWPQQQYVSGRAPDWEDWKRFQQATGAPYLSAEDQEHPLLWFPATDGEMWGFLFNFGLRPGQWYWWVPGTQRVLKDPNTGTTTIIMGEAHPEGADGKTIRELFVEAPAGLFDVDATRFLTLQEVLDGELQHHPAEDRNRCRFFVYSAAAHVHFLSEMPEYGMQTLEAQREALASTAWTCLSPHVAFWDVFTVPFWRAEVSGHVDPNPDDPEAEAKLAKMPPAERFARLQNRCFEGPDQQAFAIGVNPLGPFLERLSPAPRVALSTSPRVLPNLQQKADGAFPPETAPTYRHEQQRAAKRRLGRAVVVGEAYITTDIFAAVAQQIVWAVQCGLTIRACPHPGCGRAFVPETGKYHYCPEHRDATARSQRARSPQRPPWAT